LPERFRGGCAFGSGSNPVSPARVAANLLDRASEVNAERRGLGERLALARPRRRPAFLSGL
jgi:hypothetical protein